MIALLEVTVRTHIVCGDYRDKINFVGVFFKEVYITRPPQLSEGAPAFRVVRRRKDTSMPSLPAMILMPFLAHVSNTKCIYAAHDVFSLMSCIYSSSLLPPRAKLLEAHSWSTPGHPISLQV